MHIGIVVGEPSGAQLAIALIKALKQIYPLAEFSGLGNSDMSAIGFESIADSEIISVMGLIEPIKRLPAIIKLRKQLYQYFTTTKPDVVIGIDSPDFNLGLEVKLRRAGLKTVHYISPSVWAWRKRRIYKIKKAVNLMLTLLPFETQIYKQHHIPVAFIGHPLADDMPLEVNKLQAKKHLNLEQNKTFIAILPGSRAQEIHFMCADFIHAALLIHKQFKQVEFIIPALDIAKEHLIKNEISKVAGSTSLTIHYATGRAKQAMVAADCGILTSGTAVLEAMLAKLPCIAAYRISAISYPLLKLLIKVPFYTLPNLIANKLLVPEFIQYDITPDAMAKPVIEWLKQPQRQDIIRQEFIQLHKQLKINAAQTGAQTISKLIEVPQIMH